LSQNLDIRCVAVSLVKSRYGFNLASL